MRRRYTMLFSRSILVLVLATCVGLAEPGPSEEESACAALTDFRNLTIISADVREVGEAGCFTPIPLPLPAFAFEAAHSAKMRTSPHWM